MLAHAVLIGGVAAPHAMRENKGGLMRDQTRGRSRKLGGNQARMNEQNSGQILAAGAAGRVNSQGYWRRVASMVARFIRAGRVPTAP